MYRLARELGVLDIRCVEALPAHQFEEWQLFLRAEADDAKHAAKRAEAKAGLRRT